MKTLLSVLFALSTLNFQLSTSLAATVTGNLIDLSLAPLTTKLLFTPTTDVLVAQPSALNPQPALSAGPPKLVDALSGAFTTVLDAGDYTVSLPLIIARKPFYVSVPPGSATYDITTILTPPRTYIYTNAPDYPPRNLGPTIAPVGAPGDWFWLASVGANRWGAGSAFDTEYITLAHSADGVAWARSVDGPVFFEPNYYTNSCGPIAREFAVQLDRGQFWAAYNFDPYDGGSWAQGLGLARSTDLTNWSRLAVIYPYGTAAPDGHMFAATWFTDDDGSNYLVGAYSTGPVTATKDCFIIRRLDDTYTNWSAPQIILPSSIFKWDGALLKVAGRYHLYYVNHLGAISRASSDSLTSQFTNDYDLDPFSFGFEAPQIIRLGPAALRMYGRIQPNMYYSDSPDNGATWPEPTPLTGISWWHAPGIIRLPESATNHAYTIGADYGSVAIQAPILQARTLSAQNASIQNGLVAQDGYFLNHLRSTNVTADFFWLTATNPAPANTATPKAWTTIKAGDQSFKLPLYQ